MGQFDQPIRSRKDDLLDRSAFVAHICSALIDFEAGRSTGNTLGITGGWGSGKTSIINLVEEAIEESPLTPVVVKCDPWLVSGQKDLVTAFLHELKCSLSDSALAVETFKRAAKSVGRYFEGLSPLLELVIPGAGAPLRAIGAGLQLTNGSNDRSLLETKQAVADALEELGTPVIIIIDDIDRALPHEIVSVFQFIRAICDFPSISYLVAYDREKVCAGINIANGQGAADDFGSGFLEKVVQLEIEIPITFNEELSSILASAVMRSRDQEVDSSRLESLLSLSAGELLHTPRSAKRVGEQFRLLASMLRGEVDLVDTLGLCVLREGDPGVYSALRNNPERFVTDPISSSVYTQMMRESEEGRSALQSAVGRNEISAGTSRLLRFLFPHLDSPRRPASGLDSIVYRSRLLTALRLGLLPSAVPKEVAINVVQSDPRDLPKILGEHLARGTLAALLDRITSHFDYASPSNELDFWRAVPRYFLERKPALDASFLSERDFAMELLGIFENRCEKNERIRSQLLEVCEAWHELGDLTLLPGFLHHQAFEHGLFGAPERGRRAFLDRNLISRLFDAMTRKVRTSLVSGDLIGHLWMSDVLWLLLRSDMLDEDCRRAFVSMLAEGDVVDHLTLLFFGRPHVVEASTLTEVFGDWRSFATAVSKRCAEDDGTSVSQTLRDARSRVRENLANL